jgi:hypothetical protein
MAYGPGGGLVVLSDAGVVRQAAGGQFSARKARRSAGSQRSPADPAAALAGPDDAPAALTAGARRQIRQGAEHGVHLTRMTRR